MSDVQQAVCSHFKAHYEVTVVERPSVENLCFRTFSYNDGATLLKPFSMEEVKATVWDCDSNKAPESDEVTFGFITEFWVKLKDDIMYFVTEFHRNEKLTKGINCTFIALIPKVDSPQRVNDFGMYLWLDVCINCWRKSWQIDYGVSLVVLYTILSQIL